MRKRFFLTGFLVILFGALALQFAAQDAKAATNVPTTTEQFACRINVKAKGYGARNKKDSTKAFQKALDAAHKKGTSSKKGLVIIPKGTYYLTGTLQVQSNVYIYCESGANIVKKSARFAYLLRSKVRTKGGYKGIQNVTMEGGTWNSAFLHQGKTVGGSTICFVHGRNLKFFRLNVKNNYTTHLIELVGVENAVIDRCNLHGFRTWDKSQKKEAIQLDIVHNTNMISKGKPFDDTVCQNITITNNKVYNFPRAVGTHSAVKGRYNNNILIENNNFSNLSADAIYIFNFKDVIVRGNVMENVGKGVAIKTSGGTLYNRNKNVKAMPLLNNNYNILVENNRIRANRKGGSTDNSIIAIQATGTSRYRIGGIQVHGNNIWAAKGRNASNSVDLYLKYVDNCSVLGNKIYHEARVYGKHNTVQSGVRKKTY